jgi:hypothetical protein
METPPTAKKMLPEGPARRVPSPIDWEDSERRRLDADRLAKKAFLDAMSSRARRTPPRD